MTDKRKAMLVKRMLEMVQSDTDKALENMDFSYLTDFKITYKGNSINLWTDLASFNESIQCFLSDILEIYKDEFMVENL